MTKLNKKGLHPRNPHNRRYDFPTLIKESPDLKQYVSKNAHGDLSVDFANPRAVVALNKALLAHFYDIKSWDLPKGHLCPPIPGRADYIHYLADLLAESNNGVIPTGKKVKGLDIGVGANCIYPIIGHSVYGWRFVGSDIDSTAINSAKTIIKSNHSLIKNIKCRFQKDSKNIFNKTITQEDRFDFTMCNPPFHASKKEAMEGTERKNRNLNKSNKKKLNFGGQSNELWCPGGEAAFIKRMVKQSAHNKENCFWFTTLVSKKENLSSIYGYLKEVAPTDIRTIEMKQGQKITRIVAWTFLSDEQQKGWYKN